MSVGNLSIQYSERFYSALLSLYPVRFRVRFAPEMMQLFRDCSHDVLEKGEVAVFVAFLVGMTRDLLFSLIRERGMEWVRPAETHPLIAVIDLLLIPTMVTMKLIALGPLLTLLVLDGTKLTLDQFVMTSAFFSLAMGTLAIVASIIFTRLRPNVRLWVKLSA
jgi:hypothetical protein